MVIFISAGAFRVLGVPYKNKNIWLCRGNFLLKKNFFWQKKSLFSRTKKKKKTFPNSFHPYQSKQKAKKSLFSFILLLNIAFKPTRVQESQFSSQEYNQNGEHPLKGNQYCIKSSVLLLLSIFYFV